MQWCQILLMNELCQIIDVFAMAIGATVDPFGIPVTPKVRCDNVIIIPEFLGDPIPVVAVIAVSMHQSKWWRILITPVEVMEAQSL